MTQAMNPLRNDTAKSHGPILDFFILINFRFSKKLGEVYPLRSTLINNTDLISLTITNGVASRYHATRLTPSI